MTAGFTLIELVVVIAIVAVTTSLVVPRVWAWQRAATIARADAPDGTQCRFAYTEPPAPRTAAVVSPLLVAGC